MVPMPAGLSQSTEEAGMRPLRTGGVVEQALIKVIRPMIPAVPDRSRILTVIFNFIFSYRKWNSVSEGEMS
jgi:hypothetical protein